MYRNEIALVFALLHVRVEAKQGKRLTRARFELTTACVLDRSDNQLHHRLDAGINYRNTNGSELFALLNINQLEERLLQVLVASCT